MLAAWLDGAVPPGAPLGVAVSGGGDSMALLHLLAQWGQRPLDVVTVDHGLRPASADESAFVAAAAQALHLPHVTLTWAGWDGQGNLQDHARRARRRLISAWAQERGIGHVATGHTVDDQAETVLMRLARGSGVDGLAGMARSAERDGLTWLRPLLGTRRDTLRDWLSRQSITWCDDPSNEDSRFDRVRARAALSTLEPLGLTPERLEATATRMADARAALAAAADALAAQHLRQEGADLLIAQAPFCKAPRETRHRLLAHLLMVVSGAVYRPRYASLEALAVDLCSGRAGALQGCLAAVRGGEIRISREPAATDPQIALDAPASSCVWDRWQITGPLASGDIIGALGTHADQPLPQSRAPLPRRSLAASPAIWRGESLLAAPLAGWSAGFTAAPQFSLATVRAALVTH